MFRICEDRLKNGDAKNTEIKLHRHIIGVIYGGYEGYQYPALFGLMGTVPLTFHDEKVKNLLSPAVNRSDLRKLSYNKTIFGPR